MDDLVRFLRARLDEDEVGARSVQARRPTPWGSESVPASVSDSENILDADDAPVAVVHCSEVREHLLRHDPARVLRDIEARRALLDDTLSDAHHRNEEDHWYSCAALTDEHGESLCSNETRAPGPCDCGRDERVARRVRLLASPYVEHPDYREAWRP